MFVPNQDFALVQLRSNATPTSSAFNWNGLHLSRALAGVENQAHLLVCFDAPRPALAYRKTSCRIYQALVSSLGLLVCCASTEGGYRASLQTSPAPASLFSERKKKVPIPSPCSHVIECVHV